MVTARYNNNSANQNARSDNSGHTGSAARSFFSGFRRARVSSDVLHTAALLGPEQLKEVGGFQDAQTGLVYGSR